MTRCQVTREGALAVVLVSCIVLAVAGSLEDGLPRPAHFADAPTAAFGPLPEVADGADCDWYGFANELYSASNGLDCLDETRAALTNATDNLASSLQPYVYYTLRRMIDPANNQSFCYQGCFILDAPAPAPAFAPPAPAPVVVDSPAPPPESGL